MFCKLLIKIIKYLNNHTRGNTMGYLEDKEALKVQLDVVVQSAFDAGVASVNVGGISPAQEAADIAKAVADALKPVQDSLAALQLAKTAEDALVAQVKAALQSVAALLA